MLTVFTMSDDIERLTRQAAMGIFTRSLPPDRPRNLFSELTFLL